MENEGKSYMRHRIRIPFAMRLRRLLRGWPLLVWLFVAALAWYLYARGGQFGGMVGVVSTVVEPVAPLRTARLLSVDVVPGQRVRAGDIVARMDTSLLEAELAVAEARLGESESTISGYQQNIVNLVRQFESAIKNVETDIATVEMNRARDTAELLELKEQQKRREGLFGKGLIDEQEAKVLKPRIAALEQGVAAYPALLKTLKLQLNEISRQKEELNKWLRVDEETDITEAIVAKMEARSKIFKSSKKMFELQRANCLLRATRDGIVSLVMHEPGDVVSAGDPILRIVAERSNRIVGFLPEVHVMDLAVGQKTIVWRQNQLSSRTTAVVESVGPEVMTLPGRISPIRGQSLRGRRAVLVVEEGHDLIPGETVQISVCPPDSETTLDRLLAPFKSAMLSTDGPGVDGGRR